MSEIDNDELNSQLGAASSNLYGIWEGYKVPYLNGDVEGNKALLDAADAFDNSRGKDIDYTEIASIRGEFVYQLLKKENDIEEGVAKSLATKDNMTALLSIWTQSTER